LIKDGAPVTQEVRVGVTHCYVVMVQALGTSWLEKNLHQLLNHLVELVAHPKAAATHVDAVYSRRCAGHAIRLLAGKMLGERAQLSACKELLRIIDRLMAALDVQPDNAKESGGPETLYSQVISQYVKHKRVSFIGVILSEVYYSYSSCNIV